MMSQHSIPFMNLYQCKRKSFLWWILDKWFLISLPLFEEMQEWIVVNFQWQIGRMPLWQECTHNMFPCHSTIIPHAHIRAHQHLAHSSTIFPYYLGMDNQCKDPMNNNKDRRVWQFTNQHQPWYLSKNPWKCVNALK